MKKIIAILSLLTLLICNSYAQMPRLYTMEHGLQSTRINASFIDKEGLLWILGDRTLSFFDGNRFHAVIDDSSDFANRINSINVMEQVDDHTYLIGTGFGLYIFDSTTSRFTQIDLGEPKIQNAIPGFPISTINTKAYDGRCIITTSGFGTYVLKMSDFSIDKEQTKRFNDIVEDRFVYTTLVDNSSDLWVSTSIEPLIRISTKTHKEKPFTIAEGLKEKMNSGCPIVCMCEDPNTHNILLGVPGIGLLIYDKKANIVRETENNLRSINPRDIIYTKLGDMFVGSDNAGILQFNKNTESLTPVAWEVPGVDLRVSKVHHITEDMDGNLIASLYQSGMLVVPSHINKMTYIPVSRTGNGINSSPVSSIFRTANTYWIGTDGSGMFKADHMRFRDMQNISSGLSMLQMTSITSDANGNIWASSYGGGVQMYDGTQWVTPSYVAELSSQNVLSIVPDLKTNRIYVCINGAGLYEVDINAQTTTKIDIPEIGNRWVAHAVIDSKRNLWVMFATGLCYFNLDTREAKVVFLGDINNAQINDMVAVKDKVYFGTSLGLASFSHKTGKLTFDPINDKFTELNIMSIQPAGGDLWIAMSHSVSCVSGNGNTVTNYTTFPGFYIGELHQRSKILADENFVCFGGDNGIVAISTNKENAKSLQHIDKLLITGLSVNGKLVVYNPDSDDNILNGSILSVSSIKLNHNQNTFTINFGSTEYAHADEIEYEYMLEGYEDIWHETNSNAASAYYSSVPSGNYTLRIRARFNYSEEYIEKSINVTILHPWYSTWWAKLIYLLILVAIGWYTWHLYKIRHAEKAKLHELQQNEQIKEAKLRLFTSIAHELRTPLTMIISPLKQLKTSDSNNEHQKLYEVMQRNCDRLLNIVKQITDVRKIDNGQLHLHFSEIDFVEYCNEIMESFSSIAEAKSIQFKHFCEQKSLPLWADKVHFEKVIINILSNAFKFTPSDGKILIRTESRQNNDGTFADKKVSEYLYCSIFNSGSHIDEDDIDHIYERFYQGTAGTTTVGSGIGLNLTYELMKLHHGIIKVKNVTPDGVEFMLYLPLGKTHLTADELKPRASELTSEQASNKTQIDTLASTIATEQSLENKEGEEAKRKKHLLIVDDDKEICEYMRSQLESEYNVTVAFSGNSAWKQVLAVRPDVVITDLIMPDGDGYELCRQIKRNPETAHIPIIMLTAENNEQSHLLSMSADVDHFLSKPFNIVLLRGALGQVFRLRENLMNKMHRTDINHDYTEVEMESYEDKFFTKINDIIKKNLDDSNFTVEALAKEVGISRVHLNRKLKEHYGISPNAFIRSVRLKQAAYLLVNNKVNISEVAYKVGFASHSYFSNNFHDYFGMTPTEFVAYYSDNVNDEQLKKLLE